MKEIYSWCEYQKDFYPLSEYLRGEKWCEPFRGGLISIVYLL